MTEPLLVNVSINLTINAENYYDLLKVLTGPPPFGKHLPNVGSSPISTDAGQEAGIEGRSIAKNIEAVAKALEAFPPLAVTLPSIKLPLPPKAEHLIANNNQKLKELHQQMSDAQMLLYIWTEEFNKSLQDLMQTAGKSSVT